MSFLYRAALEKAREAEAAHLVGRILYTAGTNAFGQASWEEAEAFHREALEVAERESDTVGTALAHHGMCETLCFIGRFEEALEHGRRSGELFGDLGQRLLWAVRGCLAIATTMGTRSRCSLRPGPSRRVPASRPSGPASSSCSTGK